MSESSRREIPEFPELREEALAESRICWVCGFEQYEGREGIVVVHDSMTGEYLGCTGRQWWEDLLREGEATRLRTHKLPRGTA